MRTDLAAGGACLFGVAIGLLSGLVAWGVRKDRIADPQAGAGASQLDKSTAEKLIMAQLDQGTVCGWYGPARTTDTTWTFMDTDERASCGRALQV
jgi:hypothetical protein